MDQHLKYHLTAPIKGSTRDKLIYWLVGNVMNLMGYLVLAFHGLLVYAIIYGVSHVPWRTTLAISVIAMLLAGKRITHFLFGGGAERLIKAAPLGAVIVLNFAWVMPMAALGTVMFFFSLGMVPWLNGRNNMARWACAEGARRIMNTPWAKARLDEETRWHLDHLRGLTTGTIFVAKHRHNTEYPAIYAMIGKQFPFVWITKGGNLYKIPVVSTLMWWRGDVMVIRKPKTRLANWINRKLSYGYQMLLLRLRHCMLNFAEGTRKKDEVGTFRSSFARLAIEAGVPYCEILVTGTSLEKGEYVPDTTNPIVGVVHIGGVVMPEQFADGSGMDLFQRARVEAAACRNRFVFYCQRWDRHGGLYGIRGGRVQERRAAS